MIAIGCDHAALELKKKIESHLKDKGLDYKDFGTYDQKESDYPEYALKVANAVVGGECESGILICGTGIGMCIAANKVKGIRCALCTDTFSARMTREHNDANVLALGARITGIGLIMDIVDAFLDTRFSEAERHKRRIDKITEIENANIK